MPAQPPFLTPTRTPTIGRPALAITDLMRSAAASVSRIIWGLSRAVAIMFSEPVSNRNRLNLPNYFTLNVGASGQKGNSQHVEVDARLFRHPARVPGRVPDHADIHLSHSRHGRNCVLHHHRQFLRRRAIG